MLLYIIRHGETDYNRERIMQGYQEIPLNDRGIAQATRLAERLKGEGLDYIVSSDLRRAVMTACIIASHTNAPMEYDGGLRERNPGDLVEQPYDDEPRFFTDKIYVPPGGESIATFFKRVKEAFDRLIGREELRDKHVAVVTHGLVCHAFVAQFIGEEKGAGVGARNASMSVVRHDGDTWTVEHLDTTDHLTKDTEAIRSGRETIPGA